MTKRRPADVNQSGCERIIHRSRANNWLKDLVEMGIAEKQLISRKECFRILVAPICNFKFEWEWYYAIDREIECLLPSGTPCKPPPGMTLEKALLQVSHEMDVRSFLPRGMSLEVALLRACYELGGVKHDYDTLLEHLDTLSACQAPPS